MSPRAPLRAHPLHRHRAHRDGAARRAGTAARVAHSIRTARAARAAARANASSALRTGVARRRCHALNLPPPHCSFRARVPARAAVPACSRLPLAAARVVDAAPRLRYRRAAGGGGGGIRSTERAWATLRAAAGTVAGIARDAALPQDPPWHGGGGGEGALRYGRHAGDSGGGAYRPAGSAGLVDVLRGLCAAARGVRRDLGVMASGAEARRALARWRES
jgi:hypothetical protein